MEVKPSIVIPVYNEKGNLEGLFAELGEVLKKLPDSAEVIFVDDGSDDGSREMLKELSGANRKMKLAVHARNYGQTAALVTGIKCAAGNVIVTMDGDLQNNPRDIPALLEKLMEGYDVASGWRKERKDPFFSRRLPSAIANSLISWMTGLKLHDYGCTLKAYRSEFVRGLSLHGEMHRFLPAYCYWQGAKIMEVAVSHRPRVSGRSKYSLNRVFKVLLDLIVVKFLLSYLGKPIYVFGGIAMASFAAGTLVNSYVVARKIFLHGVWMSPLFFIGALLWTFSVTCIFLGILAEILVRLYMETGQYPAQRIIEKVNF
jgi:glycosyltransferase involved in cell wall biosynthesis